MSMSLEAMIALPLSLSILAASIGQAGPAAKALNDTASIVGSASLESRQSEDSCRHYVYEREGLAIPAVETNPQKMVEVLALARDLFRTHKGEGDGGGEAGP